MDPDVTSVIRDVFLMVAAGVFTVLCIAVIAVLAKMYRPLRDSVNNAAKTTENLGRVSHDLASVSEETAGNVAQTARNAVGITDRLKDSTEELSETVRSAGEAAKSVSAAADNVGSIAETVSRFSSLGETGGGSSGVGGMLRLFRSVFGGSRRSGDSGVQTGA